MLIVLLPSGDDKATIPVADAEFSQAVNPQSFCTGVSLHHPALIQSTGPLIDMSDIRPGTSMHYPRGDSPLLHRVSWAQHGAEVINKKNEEKKKKEQHGRMERALELECGDLGCRLTSCDLGHITNLISLGLRFLS